MVFTCKACSAALQKNDIDFQTGIASCHHCQAVMSFAADLGIEPGPPPRPKAPPAVRPWSPQPKSIRMEQTPFGLRFTRRWFNPGFIFLAFFCLFWDGFLIVWYTIGLTVSTQSGPVGGLMLLFPLIHVAVGVGLTYYTIAGFVNHTKVEIDDRTLSVEHGPLPWKGNQSVPASELSQLYCDRKISHSKNGTSVTYRLHALMKNGETRQILAGLQDQASAVYLEQQIEKRLGLRDHRVAGDVV